MSTHLETRHPDIKKKLVEYFKRFLDNIQITSGIKQIFTENKNNRYRLIASYQISKLIAKTEKRCTII